jgi:hypothetical protein
MGRASPTSSHIANPPLIVRDDTSINRVVGFAIKKVGTTLDTWRMSKWEESAIYDPNAVLNPELGKDSLGNNSPLVVVRPDQKLAAKEVNDDGCHSASKFINRAHGDVVETSDMKRCPKISVESPTSQVHRQLELNWSHHRFGSMKKRVPFTQLTQVTKVIE